MKKIKYFKYKKFDLHIHTFKKSNSLDNSNTISIDKGNVNDFYKKLFKNNIKLIAITNHNYFNYENYKLIKDILEIQPKENNKIKVLPGIEMSLYYLQNDTKKKFHMNLILNDNYEKLNSLESKINNFYNNDLKKFKNLDELISFLSKNNIKGILILDAGKSSSKIKKEKMDKDFWFYFDFFEGNLSFQKQMIYKEFEKLKEKLNSSEPKVANSVFGTDNISYFNYPDRDDRTGWTGTFFGVEASFEGLKIATYFKHFVLKMKKWDYLNDKNDKDFLPRLNYLEIHDQDEVLLDRGLNVIYGKRGSGKTYFLNKIKKSLKNKNIVGLKTIEQNEVVKIVEKLKTNEAIFLNSKNNEVLSKEKWNKKIIKIQISKFENGFSNFINEDDYEKIINKISNLYNKIVNNEISNTNFEIEEQLISKINIYFSKFNNEFLKIKEDLEKLISLKFNEKFIEISFKKSFDYQKFINEVFFKIFLKLENLKFDVSLSNIERKTSFELKNNLILKFENLTNILEKNKNLLKSIYENFENIIYNDEITHLTFKDIKMFSTNIKVSFDFSMNTLSELGKFFKIKNLDSLINEYFWKVDKKEKSSYKIDDSFKIEWKYNMNNKNIDSLSPGQRVNEYISDIFENVSTKILLVDQPEDQLDAESTTNNIIEPILNRYEEFIKKGVQIILVSHDPKIIVNMGATNLIHTFNDNGKYKIQNVSLIDFISNEKNIKIVDGKKEFVHGRSELYGRNKN